MPYKCTAYNMSTAIMVLGGNVYTVPSILSLKEAGFTVVVVDGNPEAPAFEIADVCGKFDFRDWEQGLNLARIQKVKGVMPTHDRGVVPAALISKALGLHGPSPEAARTATSKKLMRQAWSAAGLPSPAIALASNIEEFKAAVARIGFPSICKPTDDVGGGSRGVRRLDLETDLAEAYHFATSFSGSPETLVEPYYEGLEHSVEVLMRRGDGIALMISDKVKTPPPYRVDKSVIYPTRLTGEALEKVRMLSVEAARAVGLNDGAAHVELCSLPDGGNVLFEIGLRCGGGATPHPIALLTSGINEIVEYAHILTGEERNFSPKFSKGAVFHFITAKPGTLKTVAGFEAARAMPGIIEAGLTAKPGDVVKEIRTSSDRLGYFVAAGITADEAYHKALVAEQQLIFEYGN